MDADELGRLRCPFVAFPFPFPFGSCEPSPFASPSELGSPDC